MAITKKNRFEVFKRDNFVCRYCGKHPPEVTLEVDHIIPVSKNGTDDINNLITSCFCCNRGKSNIPLDKLPTSISDNIEIIKEQRKQTKQYYSYLKKIEEDKESDLTEIGTHFFKTLRPKDKHEYSFAGEWKTSMKFFLKTFNKYEIIEAIDIAAMRLKVYSGYYINENKVFKYMCGILHNWRRDRNGE